MYDPITINHYALIRHEELIREIDAFWRVELERQERGATVPADAPRKSLTPSWIAQMLTALHR